MNKTPRTVKTETFHYKIGPVQKRGWLERAQNLASPMSIKSVSKGSGAGHQAPSTLQPPGRSAAGAQFFLHLFHRLFCATTEHEPTRRFLCGILIKLPAALLIPT